MSGSERIVNEDVRHRCHLARKLGIVLLLAGIKAGVLKQDHIAVLHSGCLRLRILTDGIGAERNADAEKLGETRGNGAQAVLRVDLALRLAHVGAEDDLRALRHQILDRRKRLNDTLVRGDLAVLLGYVEVAANEHALTCDVNVFDGLLVVGCHGFRLLLYECFYQPTHTIPHSCRLVKKEFMKIVKKKTEFLQKRGESLLQSGHDYDKMNTEP